MNPETYRIACSLFHKACSLPAEGRDAFVEEHCCGKAELLALVRELLANDPESAGRMDLAERPARDPRP